MKLLQLFERTDFTLVKGNPDIDISALVYDSRKAGPGSLFVCIVGAVSDGHNYIPDVIKKGASAILVQDDRLEHGLAADEEGEEALEVPEETVIVSVPDTRRALAFLSAAWFGYPAEKLPVIGITGTKGKTTTTYMVKSVLDAAGIPTGLIGTIEVITGKQVIKAKNTTPESYLVQEYLREMLDNGMKACVMEVSSQALKLDRTAGILFETGVFTNLSEDHIGPAEHKDFEDYLRCKSLLFRQCRVGIVNGDSPYADRVLENRTCEVERFGIGEGNDLRATDIELVHRPGELGVRFRTEGLIEMEAEVPAPGRFSVYNALCAIAICRHFGVTPDNIAKALLQTHVKGRIEMVKVSDKFTLMIDYAHNAMALDSLLQTLREYEPGRLVCVFGCGGNRSRQRRFEMGEVSGRQADLTIITSDNPRYEEPRAIMEDIVTGIRRTKGAYIQIQDRKEAIRYAIRSGMPGDIIVLAGKGHEDYQEIRGVKYPMDERVLIQEILAEEAAR
ncbi:MAG: UDP-N-acetylmuramoyl-L-alanyl-D-glutamate--2,6-diaminopimelate ligase [Lachnospiraceae bacterium]|nr:UDP-N-acetylmuramoyl-L-alanyl-D-glutamate--2,6-diaminopimelate ligase [Lachnospiraceae bacterium]